RQETPRALREVAGADRSRRRRPHAHPAGPGGERIGPRALRGAVPGGRDRSDRRARGADGRRALARALLRGDRGDAAHGLRRAVGEQSAARGHAAEAEHGVAGRGLGPSGAGRAGRAGAERPMSAEARAVLGGGGPAAGINAVIAAATIEARNRGLTVLGCHDGYQWLMKKDTSHVEELEIASLSRIHFEGGSVLRTSRANPACSAETLQNVADSLQDLGAASLLTIGGDDTASGAAAVARVLGG